MFPLFFWLQSGRLSRARSETCHAPLYLKPTQEDFNQIPELQVCLVEALFDIEGVLADPSVFPEQELMRSRDQILSNLERAFEISGGSKDHLSAMMLQISQVVAREFRAAE